jgi:hypothetical protein
VSVQGIKDASRELAGAGIYQGFQAGYLAEELRKGQPGLVLRLFVLGCREGMFGE